MVRRSRRLFVLGLGVVVALVACDPVNPPEVGPMTEGPVTAYGPDPAPQVVAVASEGGDRAVAWGDRSDDLLLDRYDDSSTTPAAARPVVLLDLALSDPDTSIEWTAAAVALGNGFALVSATSDGCDPQGCGSGPDVITLRRPSNASVPLSGDSSALRELCDPSQGIAATDFPLSWNGSRFLVAKECFDRVDLFTVSTAGVVASTATFTTSNASDLELSSAGGGFLATYEATNGAGNVDVRTRRVSGAGTLVGGAVTIAGGTGDQVDPAPAGSGSAHLVAWVTTGNGHDVRARTIGTDGTLGTTRVLSNQAGDQDAPALAGGAGGTWFAVWTDADFADQDVVGTKVLPSGAPVTSGGATLAGGANDQRAPLLTSGASSTAFLTWFTPGMSSSDIDLTRRLDADGVPFGPTTRSTRRPIAQTCFDVAAGNGQYLVTWQESRVVGNTNLFAQRYGPSGTPTGPTIALSTAPGDQFCPTAAWNGSKWLVAWTDRRSGTRDVFGTFVSGTGAVSPVAGFAISAAAIEQQSPSVAWNGSTFVVAWNDRRNGGQDIFAARVAPNGAVIDANGIAVSTAPGIQRAPSVSSAGGPTLIAWTGTDVQRRILRSNGTFLGGIVSEGPAQPGPSSTPSAVASPDRMGVLYEDATPADVSSSDVVFVDIDPTNGATLGKTTLRSIDGECEVWPGGDLSYDGTSITFLSGIQTGCEDFSAATVGTITGDTILDADAPEELMGARLASLPDQRSLLVDQRLGRIIVAPVDDAPT